MSSTYSIEDIEKQEECRITFEKQTFDRFLSEAKANREKVRELVNKDRVQMWATLFENVIREEEGPEPVQWEEIIELQGLRINRTERSLGEGKFTHVYKASWKETQKEIAVKVIRFKELCTFYDIKDRDEHLKILLHLNHPKITRCIKTFLVTNTNKIYMFMQLASLGNVNDFVLSKNKPIPLKLAKMWIKDALEALSFLHAIGIAHRAVKPNGLLLNCSNGCVKLSVPQAFAKVFERDRQGRYQLVKCKISGDPNAYTAPESLFGQPFDPILADMWAIGCVLYFMLVMKPPFANWESKSGFREELDTQRWQYCGIVDKSPKLDESSKQFLSQFLKEAPEQRPNAVEILAHSWLKS